MTRPKNAARSRQARTGTATEELLQYHINAAQAAGVAYVTKRATPVRITSVDAKGRVTGRLEASPGVDYCGVLQDGRAVYFEVKTCSKASLDLDAIRESQWDEIDRVRRFGAVCALIVLWRPPSKRARALIGGRSWAWCVFPWAFVLGQHERALRSLESLDLACFAVSETANPVARLMEAR